MDGWKTNFLLGISIFRGYVSFRGGKFFHNFSAGESLGRTFWRETRHSHHASGGKAKFTLLRKASGEAATWQDARNTFCNTVSWFRNPANDNPVDMGRISHYLQWFRTCQVVGLGISDQSKKYPSNLSNVQKKNLTQTFQVGIIFLQHGFFCKWGWSSKTCSLIPVYLQILASEKKHQPMVWVVGLGPGGLGFESGYPIPGPKPTTQTISWNERSTKKYPLVN